MATTGTQVTQEELDEILIDALLTGTVLKWGGIAVEDGLYLFPLADAKVI